MIEVRIGERYRFSLEGGVGVEAIVCELSAKQIVIEPPDVVPWAARLRLPLKSVYSAERLWQSKPRPIDPHASEWNTEMPWLVWAPGVEPIIPGVRRLRQATDKPLFPEAIDHATDHVTRVGEAGDSAGDGTPSRRPPGRRGRTRDQSQNRLQQTSFLPADG